MEEPTTRPPDPREKTVPRSVVAGPFKERVTPLRATPVLPRGVKTSLPAVRISVAALLLIVAKAMVEVPTMSAPDEARE